MKTHPKHQVRNFKNLLKRFLKFSFFIILILTFASCKKEKNEQVNIEKSKAQQELNESFAKHDNKTRVKLTKKIRKNNSNSAARIAPPNEEPSEFCIDWYWTVYDAETGEVYSETFLYTTCGDETGGGGGGGGNGTPNQCLVDAQNNFNAFLNDGATTSTDYSSQEDGISNTNGEITKYVTQFWIPYTASTYKLISVEKGVAKLKSSTNTWLWKSLVHSSIYMDGTAPLGYNVTFSQGVGTPSFTPETAAILEIIQAKMLLYFSVTKSSVLSCTINGVTYGMPSSSEFNWATSNNWTP